MNFFAYAGWSNLETVTVSSTQDWTSYPVLATYKETLSDYWDLHVSEKTMWSNPSIKLVSYSGTTVSNSLSGVVGSQKGTGNAGVKGNYYYGAIKPSWNQTGTDSIRLEVNAR